MTAVSALITSVFSQVRVCPLSSSVRFREHDFTWMQVSRGSAGEYQVDERGGIARTTWRLSVRSAGRCREAQIGRAHV